MSARERPRDPREIAAGERVLAWRMERIRLGHPVDKDGRTLPPPTPEGWFEGETASERNMRRMTAADRLAFPDEWIGEPPAGTARTDTGGQFPLVLVRFRYARRDQPDRGQG